MLNNNLITLCYVESAVHLGLGLDSWLKIEIGRPEQQPVKQLSLYHGFPESKYEKQLYYCPEYGSLCYIIPPDVLGWYAEVKVSENCCPSGVVFELRLPKQFKDLYENIRSSFRSSQNASGDYLFPPHMRRGAELIIRKNLKEFSEKFGIKANPDSLRRCFRGYYVGKYGLNPVVASYLSSFDSEHRADRFYQMFDPIPYHEEWYRCFSSFRREIIENLKAMSRIDGSIQLGEDLMSYLEPPQGLPSLDGVQPFGSKVVPITSRLIDFFGKLKNKILSFSPSTDTERYDYHNLYCLYVFLVFQFSSSLRPICDAPIYAQLFDIRNNLVVIADKDSPHNIKECRVVRVPDLTMSLLKRLTLAAERMRLMLSAKKSTNSRNKRHLFYLIDADRTLITNMKEDSIRAVLTKNGLHDLYDFPLNAPRHYLMTHMPQHLHFGIVKAFVGHKTSWMDPYSTGTMESLKVVAAYVQHLLEQLGVVDLEYKSL